jgi:Fe-S cluster biogenesis protein NfuA
MFIMTEETPNPDTLKFIPRQDVMGLENGQEFDRTTQMPFSPFVQSLFKIEDIARVYLGKDFISVTAQGKDWLVLKPFILETIVEHYLSGRSFIEESSQQNTSDQSSSGKIYTPEETEIVAQIVELIDTRVRPAVAQDGGDITFELYEDGIVYVKLKGACSGCPSSTATLKGGIENMMKHYIPEVQEVRAM